MKLKKLALSALLLSLSSPLLASTSVGTCDGCSDWDYKDIAITAGVGTRYVVDYPNGVMKRYAVTQTNSYYFRATEEAVSATALSGFNRLRSVFLADPAIFTRSIIVRVPTDEVGGVDPVSLSLFGEWDQGFSQFRFNFSQFLSNYDRVRQYSQPMADSLDGVRTITTGVNVWYTPFYAENSQSSPSGAFDVYLCTNNGDCALIQVRSDGSWDYIMTVDAWGNPYPSPEHPNSPSIGSGYEFDNYLARVRNALEARGISFIGAAWGASRYMSCSYRNGVPIGCRIE